MNDLQRQQSPSDKPLVVIGSGLAGYTFIREFRKLDADRKILLLTADDGHSYSKPLLSTGFAKGKNAEHLSMADAGKMASQLDIDIRTHTRVTAIDPEARRLDAGFEGSSSSAGETIEFTELVLALGAEVVRPPLSGSAADEVLSVNSLMDYRRFRERLVTVAQQRCAEGAVDRPIRIVIMGSGLIGCEFANDLLASVDTKFTVDVISPDSRPLQRALPEQVSLALGQGLEEAGARFHWQSTVGSVDHVSEASAGGGSAYLVSVDGGELRTLQADVVLSATGLRPHSALAAAAGLEVSRGIVVDRQLRTSKADIFALGDCAEVDGHLLLYVQPLMQCARLLAANLAGGHNADLSYQAMPVIVKTPACPLVLAPPPEGLAGEWTVAEADRLDVRALFHDTEGSLRGFALSGRHVIEKQTLLRDLPPLLA
ncbi:FAD-dependent oxidoreductase [Allohahella marinimesophila]|uniref:FAD-dependent oxidoreductase n=1 Tax=Allohahella marinimesophila TaxID=1054972 RepID=A0ABP7PWG3_9GAMM